MCAVPEARQQKTRPFGRALRDRLPRCFPGERGAINYQLPLDST